MHFYLCIHLCSHHADQDIEYFQKPLKTGFISRGRRKSAESGRWAVFTTCLGILHLHHCVMKYIIRCDSPNSLATIHEVITHAFFLPSENICLISFYVPGYWLYKPTPHWLVRPRTGSVFLTTYACSPYMLMGIC